MDIFLAVAVFIVTSAIAYLGFQLTLHPAETNQAKRQYRRGFVVLTAVAAGLIVWQSLLNRHEQDSLHSQLNKIQNNTEQPPNVTVRVPSPSPSPHTAVSWIHIANPALPQPGPLFPFSKDEQPKLNMGFSNGGNYAVSSTRLQGVVVVVPFTFNQAEVYKAHIDDIVKAEVHSGGTLPPHEPAISYHTSVGPRLSDQDAMDLNSGVKMLCGLAVVTWYDTTGIYRTSFNECTFHEPGDGFNWHSGDETDKEQKLNY